MLPDGRKFVNVSTNKTLVAADSGIIQNVIADAITITLPATALGLHFIIRNGGAKKTGGPVGSGDNASVLVKVSPQAADGFTGNGFTAAVNKAAQNTKATAVVGDEIAVNATGTAGVTAYVFNRVRGIWAREA